jgi:hypothetical protein
MTLKEYVRLQCGDNDSAAQALTDDEIHDLLIGAAVSPQSQRFGEIAQSCLTGIQVLNRAGWVELTLTQLDREGRKFGCGVGGWLDDMTDVYVGETYYPLAPGESVNDLTGVVELAEPQTEKVSVRTYLVDLRKAVHDALLTIAGSESRLAIKADAGGAGADLTKVAAELRAQAKEVLGHPTVIFAGSKDYPH